MLESNETLNGSVAKSPPQAHGYPNDARSSRATMGENAFQEGMARYTEGQQPPEEIRG